VEAATEADLTAATIATTAAATEAAAAAAAETEGAAAAAVARAGKPGGVSAPIRDGTKYPLSFQKKKNCIIEYSAKIRTFRTFRIQNRIPTEPGIKYPAVQ
jgi:hypothetical protein